MRRWMGIPVAAVMVTACVTINVYFPAAEAREAAREFVDKVIGEENAPAPAGGEIMEGDKQGGPSAMFNTTQSSLRQLASRVDLYTVLGIGSAHAQSPDISIKTPAIQAIQARMATRFNTSLRAGFDAGALGFASDGTIVVRDAAKLPLKDRASIQQSVAEDNRDRNAVYREVAVANGHPEWEAQIRDVFAQQWAASARSGWWYQSGGSWKQK